MKTENLYEEKYWSENKLIIGIDEAGRGPLAGPLVVAGVIFPFNYDTKDIYDSKKLSAKKREELFQIILHDALYYNIQIVDEKTIDELNILGATKMATAKIALDAPCNIVLTDAVKLNINKEVIDLVKGDQKSGSIAAGSILAKVTRDHLMDELDLLYPQYNFKKNKGYPTAEHLAALKKYGITNIHRHSYRPVAEAAQLSLF
ncbi:MAG: ribonuclease HII [Erysipelotrichia bacterium]|nr:ribonuclease HII [Erysipelotrichia bacterium]